MKRIVLFCFILSTLNINAQTRFNIELSVGIDTTLDLGVKVIQSQDHKYVSCGISMSPFSNYNGAYIVKTDSSGHVIWKKQYDFSIGEYDSFTDLVQLPDSNYLVTGITTNTLTSDYDVILTKIDTGGNIIWFNTYLHPDYDQSSELKLTPDGKVIIVGKSESVGVYNDVLLIKTDINGNLIWRKRFGNTYDEVYNSIEVIKNNTEYLLGGKYGYSSSGTDYYDMSIMRTDTAGNIIWQQQYGTPGGNETSGCTLQTLDSGFVMSGTFNSSGALVKLDKNGNQKWAKNYGFPTDSYIRYVKQLPDSSFAFIVSYTYAPTNSFTGFLNKTDKNGNLLWQRIYPGPMTIPNFFFGFNTTADKGFIMTGQYNHIGQPYQNMWLVKTDSLGCDSVTCSYLPTSIKTNDANTGNFSLYPNPNKGSFKIVLKDVNDEEGLTTITISNLLGQTVLTKTVNTNVSVIVIQDERLFAGVYIVTLSRENKTIGQSKIIIE